MRVYIDTGIFIDYLNGHSSIGASLRSANRRGRTPQQLAQDASTVFQRIVRQHQGATSALTCCEAEEALYAELVKAARGVPNAKKLLVPTARSIVLQVVTAAQFFRINILDLSNEVINLQLSQLQLHTRGVRAADSLHLATAITFDADIVLAGDRHILSLNNRLMNARDRPIRCCDTDIALTIL